MNGALPSLVSAPTEIPVIPPPEEQTLVNSQAAQTVTRVDRWRYRSAVHAAQVLNSMARREEDADRPRLVVRPRESVESGGPRTS